MWIILLYDDPEQRLRENTLSEFGTRKTKMIFRNTVPSVSRNACIYSKFNQAEPWSMHHVYSTRILEKYTIDLLWFIQVTKLQEKPDFETFQQSSHLQDRSVRLNQPTKKLDPLLEKFNIAHQKPHQVKISPKTAEKSKVRYHEPDDTRRDLRRSSKWLVNMSVRKLSYKYILFIYYFLISFNEL